MISLTFNTKADFPDGNGGWIKYIHVWFSINLFGLKWYMLKHIKLWKLK